MRYLIILCILLSTTLFAKTSVSYQVIDLETNKAVTKQNENTISPLASVSKLFTMYYALSVLGPDATFKTTIKTTKAGDIILVGGSDPFFTVQDALSLIHQIKQKGVSKVTGKFLVDISQNMNLSSISNLGLEDQADNSSLSAMNMEFNRFEVVRGMKDPIPNIDFLKITSANKTSNGLKYKLLKIEGYPETWERQNKESHKYIEELPAKNSALYSAYFFRHIAGLNGINLPNPSLGNIEESSVIAEHTSKTVSELAKLAIEYSNNLIAEQLLIKASNNKENLKNNADKMITWFQQNIKGIDYKSLSLVNGSGISLRNKTSPAFMSSFLSTINKRSISNKSFWSYLSINGHSGGIAKRLKTPKLSFRVYGKTGSLHFVNNLAGYFTGKSGKQYAFAILTTEASKRALLNKNNSKEVNKSRRLSRSWHQESTIKIDSLLMRWINKY